MPHTQRRRAKRASTFILFLPALAALGGCATLGSVMSPYSEKFSCKNDDHGQCIHPDKAYADAVAGTASKSDPAVTRDKAKLRGRADTGAGRNRSAGQGYAGYRESVYRELQGLIDQPVTPMLKPPRTVRTLILPYSDQHRPDRLYMQRYVFSILERPQWVVGDYLVTPQSSSLRVPILEQVQERGPALDERP
ncbi:conjugal transfer pilus assembly protein TraV [Sphingomonas laterariae]|uniref:Conjugal transfer pilus assembly protein TraV n=1 Tax=Edaphosphingomonas laterariae TaxID=861865 RepID=A0A239GGW6_9SPHN|nr:TraV family lipoprotein [Sphingomonas laterariae]SNS67723.1 conjugal transfer pilus assembly protein TraV [Sphingomonas laterariae]